MDAAAKKQRVPFWNLRNEEKQRCAELADYFEQDDWTIVNNRWDIERQCRCFEFRKGTHYLLDVDLAVFQNQETDKIIEQLEAAHWRNVLERCVGKQVPRFGADGKFTFRPWPTLAKSASL